ncbi:hyaluronan mediated motility receptor-like isoform X1 [Frieseomelitta varia]|uniref:hyaluronan mediated motility receptor-like isoform X1 n=1 Tax=Frieseomelitta varia TaxID=561572 RepID=UPI001CB6AF06|nr:hyaluronan mediated motility receptor-like isoform X1 [Frieseomelitta varia]
MSFSKARLQRFNEFENDVPPPGAYDPNFGSKVKGFVIEKSERFHDSKSVGSAEGNVTICNKHANNVAASFRTPQLPRKQTPHQTRSSSKLKPRALIASNDQKLKYNTEHQLADLQVECFNKDKTIRELKKHIEDMKGEVQKLELQLEELRKKQTDVEEQHRKDIETMAAMQQEILNDYDEKHQMEAKHLRCQLSEVLEEKEREIQARKTIEGDLRNRIADFSKRIVALESELINSKHTNNIERIQFLEIQIEEQRTKLEEITMNHKREVDLLEQEKSKLNSYVDNLTNERDKLELKLQKRQDVILELQGQLSTLQCELDELKAEYEKVIETSSKQMDDLKYKYEKETDQLKLDFEKEKMILVNENQFEISRRIEIEAKVKDIDQQNNFLREELANVQKLSKDVNNRLHKAHEELEESERKHILVLKKHQEELADVMKLHDEEKYKLKQQLESARVDYIREIENLTIARDKEIAEVKETATKKSEEEIKRVKQYADKIVANAEAVTRETLAACRTECEERVKRVIADSDAKVSGSHINAMIREAKITVEEEMRLTAERYKACLARVEMERTALDEKLAHKDAEINRLSATLKELKNSAETQESFSQSLQIELDRAETELAEKREELRALKDQIRTEAAEMVIRRKRFEVVMAENQASVAALTKRLAQSNAEVERLQHELKRGEDCIGEHRDLLSIMRNNSKIVHEQVRVLMEQLDIKKGLVDQLEAESVSEMESLKSVFEAKIDDFKNIAAKKVAKLQAENDVKTAENVEMKNQLEKMANHLTEAQSILLELEERNDAQELEISRVVMLNAKLNAQLKQHETTIEDLNKLLQHQSQAHKVSLNEANLKIEELSVKIKCHEEEESHIQKNVELFEEERKNWESFEKEIMEKLEEEKARREAAEKEMENLSKYNEQLLKDYQEIHEKYAEVVGHHNHRQRIKHVSQLKDKINQLEQDVYAKTRTITQLQKVVEKFKAEEKRTHSKGKENTEVSQSNLTTLVPSPHKSLTPLKDRN